MNRYIKNGVITTGSDNVELDSPTFKVIKVDIDTETNILTVEILHEVNQGSLIQKHSRIFEVPFSNLSSAVKQTGLEFLQAIESKILELPQYNGATKQ